MDRPVALDEYPIHQVPVSMKHVGTSDRNFYDRCIFQGHDRTGEIMLITGLGVYPNLGIVDAYACVRRGDRQWTIRTSDALDDDRGIEQRVGPYRIDVEEPLKRLHLVCDGDDHGLGLDLVFEAAFPALGEPQHVYRQGHKTTLDASRFCQPGSWGGVIRIEGEEIAVDPQRWVGTRDRSWGIRPVGEQPSPPGLEAEQPTEGFWWVWTPLRFDDFWIMVIAQEQPDGHRVLNQAVRVWPEEDRSPEQLGWPEFEIRYRSGTRHPEGARIHLTERGGKPLTLEVDTFNFIALNVGCGYNGDPDWNHGVWRGRDFTEGAVYDYTDPAVAGRVPFNLSDHVARAFLDGAEGWGIFEHGSFGRHEPSGFESWEAVAP